mmetsp:Transcript_14443/g.31347  ORF Transcript_14443/g.31347 Transcript_14443/m.31347 type:complete len:211 (-) Transcript_14443:414-1046(-)
MSMTSFPCRTSVSALIAETSAGLNIDSTVGLTLPRARLPDLPICRSSWRFMSNASALRTRSITSVVVMQSVHGLSSRSLTMRGKRMECPVANTLDWMSLTSPLIWRTLEKRGSMTLCGRALASGVHLSHGGGRLGSKSSHIGRSSSSNAANSSRDNPVPTLQKVTNVVGASLPEGSATPRRNSHSLPLRDPRPKLPPTMSTSRSSPTPVK